MLLNKNEKTVRSSRLYLTKPIRVESSLDFNVDGLTLPRKIFGLVTNKDDLPMVVHLNTGARIIPNSLSAIPGSKSVCIRIVMGDDLFFFPLNLIERIKVEEYTRTEMTPNL